MTMFYSPSTNGFFHSQYNSGKIPIDAIEITELEHQQLLKELSNGKSIFVDSNKTITTAYTPAAQIKLSDKAIEAMRRVAYQTEADPLFFKWQRGEATEAEWLAKIAEIKARYPG